MGVSFCNTQIICCLNFYLYFLSGSLSARYGELRGSNLSGFLRSSAINTINLPQHVVRWIYA